ncbi:hypothetical protein NHJ13734_008580 [Beauveria thailandica]
MKYALVITMLYAALASTEVAKLDALQEHDSDVVRRVPPTIDEEKVYAETRYDPTRRAPPPTIYEEKVYEETRYDPTRRGLPPIIEEEEYDETRY